MLLVDLDAPRKQRHTATRIFRRLLDEQRHDERVVPGRTRVRRQASHAIEQVKTDVLAAAKGLTDKGFTLEFRSVKYSREELEQLATQLFDTMGVWAPGLKPAIGGGWDPEMNRVDVAVRLDTGQASAWIERLRALNDDRITFHTFTPVGDGWESRLNDFAPWTTGAWLSFDPGLIATTTNAECTLGYAWRKWSTNVRYGGTANHCTGQGAWVIWYNNTDEVGRVAWTSPASDAMLLGGSTYSPTVWVGSAGTTDIRDVKAIDTSWDPGMLLP